MLHRKDLNYENIPVGALGIIPLIGCKDRCAKVNDYLVKWRKEKADEITDSEVFNGYLKDSYIIECSGAKIWFRRSKRNHQRICTRKRLVFDGGCM